MGKGRGGEGGAAPRVPQRLAPLKLAAQLVIPGEDDVGSAYAAAPVEGGWVDPSASPPEESQQRMLEGQHNAEEEPNIRQHAVDGGLLGEAGPVSAPTEGVGNKDPRARAVQGGTEGAQGTGREHPTKEEPGSPAGEWGTEQTSGMGAGSPGVGDGTEEPGAGEGGRAPGAHGGTEPSARRGGGSPGGGEGTEEAAGEGVDALEEKAGEHDPSGKGSDAAGEQGSPGDGPRGGLEGHAPSHYLNPPPPTTPSLPSLYANGSSESRPSLMGAIQEEGTERTRSSASSRPEGFARDESTRSMVSHGTTGSGGTTRSREEARMATLEEHNRKLQAHVKRAATANGGLDRRLKSVSEAVGKASADSVLSTSKPIAAAVCKNRYRVFLGLMAVYCMASASSATTGAVASLDMEVSYPFFRMRVLGVRGEWSGNANTSELGSTLGDFKRDDLGITRYKAVIPGPDVPNVGRIGILLRSFPLLDDPEHIEWVNGAVTIQYNGYRDMNGWYFTTGPDNPYYDPVVFVFEGSRNGYSWDLLSSSTWNTLNSTINFRSHPFDSAEIVGHNTPLERRKAVSFDMMPSMLAHALTIGDPILFCLGLTSAICCGFFGMERWAKFCIILPVVLSGAFHVGVGVALYDTGMELASIPHFLLFLWLMLTASCFQWWERWSTQLVCISTGGQLISMGLGVGFFGMSHVPGLAASNDIGSSEADPFRWVDLTAGVFLTVFGTMILVLRWKAVGVSWWSIRKDKKTYDGVWMDLMLQDPTFPSAVSKLREAVQWVQQTVGVNPVVRQRCEVQGAMGITRMEPLTSLDTLYNQAAGAELVLRDKVIFWADASKGLFPLQKDRSLDRGQSFDGGEQTWIRVNGQDIDSMEMVKWPKIKTPERAIEKLMRSYGGDVSRLVDVSRQTIVFESLDDLASCFIAICRDSEVDIVRVKNRLDTGYRSSASAGYRDMNINLRLKSQAAIDNGINSHICEVQLILKAFAELKSAEGHARYVAFRNTRGE
uniref:Uncharacterized protein n=1 Tax=Hemiselmis tepida TaxID=464990 RepID=A0A7S0W7E2_9CRYP|mmetsp:Transcript_7137/g.18158  ORF Transcript_7137/g.18158 Transcript_7137/m.18158 type:complete len:1001 (+) Transcript_7137:132-3134(+)